jgi:Xaa-Pro dipeptidase
MLSSAEKERRHGFIRQILETKNLEALLLIGDPSVNFDFAGDYRYFTNNRTIVYREAIVLCRDAEPVLLTTTSGKLPEIAVRSFVRDCRFTDNMIDDVVKLLKERAITSGKIGVNFEMLSVAWYAYLKQALPGIEWVETHEQIMQIRGRHSQEETDVMREGAKLGDGSYEAALKAIRPGATESEIVADLEHYSRARGAEEHFTLIGSSKFGFNTGTNNIFYYPTSRRIEIGDTVLMEITPRLQGYWTQLVRAVSVGERNNDLGKIQNVCREAIKRGLEQVKPGKKVSEIVLAMDSCVTGRGYVLGPPFGHICGVDLVEDRVSPRNTTPLTPGTTVIIHPTVFTPDRKNWSFCGETYLVTQDGYERLHHASDEFVTV